MTSGGAGGAEGGLEIDVLHHVHRTAARRGARRSGREVLQHMLVGRAVADRLEGEIEQRGIRRLLVRRERGLVLPALHDDEAVGPGGLLHDREFQVSGLARAQVAILLEQA